jgi:AbrB family looped-hinge helix DNA binding protein
MLIVNHVLPLAHHSQPLIVDFHHIHSDTKAVNTSRNNCPTHQICPNSSPEIRCLTDDPAQTIILPVRLYRKGVSMVELATTKMSSKGQVVIPEEIRKRLGLEAGAQFVVVADKDTVILKAISPPAMEEFDSLLAEARKQARKAGMKQADIEPIISEVRSIKPQPPGV